MADKDNEGDLPMNSGKSSHRSLRESLDGSRGSSGSSVSSGSRGSRGSSKMDMGTDMGAAADAAAATATAADAAADTDLEDVDAAADAAADTAAGAATDTDETAATKALTPDQDYGKAIYNNCLKQPPKFSIVNFAICFRHLVDSYVNKFDCTIKDNASFECFLNNMFVVFGGTDNTFLKIISEVWNNIKDKDIKKIFRDQASINAIRDSYAPFLNKLALTFKVDREHDLNGKRGTAHGIEPPMDVRKLLKMLGLGFSNNKIDAKCFARDTTTGKINKILKDEGCNEQLVYIANLKDTAGTKHLVDGDHYLIGCKRDECKSSQNKNIVEIFILNLCHLFYVSHQSELIYTAAKTQKPFLTPKQAAHIFDVTYKSQSDKLTRCIYFKYVLKSSKIDYSEYKGIIIKTTIIQDGVGSQAITDHSFDCELQDTSLFSVKSVIAFANLPHKVDSFKTCFKKKLTDIGYSEEDANKMFLLFAATNKGAGDFDQVGENVIFNTISYIVLREAEAAGASGAADSFENFIKARGCITATSDTYLYVIALLMECAILLATPLERSVFMSAWSKFKENKLGSVHKALVDISIVDESPLVEDCGAVSSLDFKPPDTFYAPPVALPVYYLPSSKDTMGPPMLFFATLIFSILHNIGVKGIFKLNEIFNIEYPAGAAVGGTKEEAGAGAAFGEGEVAKITTRAQSTIKPAREDSQTPIGYKLSATSFFDDNFYNSFMKYCSIMNTSMKKKTKQEDTRKNYERYIHLLSSDNIEAYATSSGNRRIREIFDDPITVHFPFLSKYVGTFKTKLCIMAKMIAQNSMYIIEGKSPEAEYTLCFRPFTPYYHDLELKTICRKSDELSSVIPLGEIKEFYTTKIDEVFPKTKEMLKSDPSMHLMQTNYNILTLGHFTFLLYNLFEQYINMHLNYLVYEDLHRVLLAIILIREKPADYKDKQFKAVICKELKINFSKSPASALSPQMKAANITDLSGDSSITDAAEVAAAANITDLSGDSSITDAAEAAAATAADALSYNASSFNFYYTSVIPHSNETSLSLANYLEPDDKTICDLCILLLSGVIFLSEIIKKVKANDNIFKLEFKHWIDILERKGDLPPDKKYGDGNKEKAHISADIEFNRARSLVLVLPLQVLPTDQKKADLMDEINKKTIEFHKIFETYFVKDDVNAQEKSKRDSHMKLICAWYNSLIDHIFKHALIPGVRFVKSTKPYLYILDIPTNSNSKDYEEGVAVIFKTLQSSKGFARIKDELINFYSNKSTKAVVQARTTVMFTVLHGNIKKHTDGTPLMKIANEYKKTSLNYESIGELLELFRIDFSTIVENLIKSIILFIFREDYCGNEDNNKQRKFILILLENYLTLFYHVDTLVDNIIEELKQIIKDLSENILSHIYEDSDDVSKRQVVTAKIIETFEEEKEVFEDKLVHLYKKTFSCKKENLKIILKPLFDALKVCDDYLKFISEPMRLEANFNELLNAFIVLQAQIELITNTLRSIKNSFSTEDEKQLIAELVVTHFNEILAVFKLGDMASELEKLAKKCKSDDQSHPDDQSHSEDQSHPEAHQDPMQDPMQDTMQVTMQDTKKETMMPGGGGKLTIKKRKKLAIKGGASLKDVVLNIIDGMKMNKDGRRVFRLEGRQTFAKVARCVVRMNKMETETRDQITELLDVNNINDTDDIKEIINSIYDSSKMCDDEGKESERIKGIIEKYKGEIMADGADRINKINEEINNILLLDYKYNYNFLGKKLEKGKKLCQDNFDELTKYDEGGTRSVDNTIFHDKEAFTTEFGDYVGKLPIGASVMAKFYRGDNQLYKGIIVGYTGEESYMVLFDDSRIGGPHYTNPRYVKLLELPNDDYVNSYKVVYDRLPVDSLVWAEFYDEKEWYFGKANEWYPGIIVKDNSNDNYSVEFLYIDVTQITHRQHIKPRDEDDATGMAAEATGMAAVKPMGEPMGAARRGQAVKPMGAARREQAMDEDRLEGRAVKPMGEPMGAARRGQKRTEPDPTPRLSRQGSRSGGGKLLNKMGLINKATSILAKPKSKPKSKITKASLEKQTQKDNEILAKTKTKPKTKPTKGSLEKQTQKENEILAKTKPKITKASLEKQTQKENEILDKPKPKPKITKASLEKQTQKNIEILDKPKPKTKITKASLEKQTQKNIEILDKPKPKPKSKPKPKITKASLEKQTQKDNEILAKPKPKPKPKITK